MFPANARQRSIAVYHLHMGGPDADALEVQALRAPRFEPRLRGLGVTQATSARDADVVVVTGLLTERNLDAVLAEIALMPSPSVLVAAGDCAVNGGQWARIDMPDVSPYPLSHYADVQITVPGNPPNPQAIISALASAARTLANPAERLTAWQDE